MKVETMKKTGCVHFWQLYPATTGGFTGYCKFCGEERHFVDPGRLMTPAESQEQRRVAAIEVAESRRVS